MADIFRVAVLDDYQGVALTTGDWSRLEGRAAVTAFRDHVTDADQLVARLEPFDAVIAMRERTPFPREVLERLPRLRLIVTAGMVNAAVDLDAAAALGVSVCGTEGRISVVATVELTWALILSVVRSLPREDAAIRAGGWQVGVGTVLHGKTLGILGLGNIGPMMVPVGRAFGMDIIAWSRNLTDARAAEVGVRRVDKGEFFSRSDVVTVHLKLGPGSEGYVGREELRLMKPTAYLVNTSRGPLVDEAALVEALRDGWIAGAGLDVFDVEPLPLDHPLRHLPTTVLSPHIGYVSRESYRLWYASFIEDVDRFLAGDPVRVIAAPAP